MRAAPDCDVSVILPFDDDEDRVGKLSRRVAAHLRELGLTFEILAVDEGSGDESVFVLSFVKTEVPELRLLQTPGVGQGFAAGTRVARGRTLWLIDVAAAEVPLSPFLWAHQRLSSGVADVVPVEGRYVLCRRTRAWPVLAALRGRGDAFERRLLRRAYRRGLVVETLPRPASGRAFSRMLVSLSAYAPARFQGYLRSRA